jgi:hypothetical protein
MTFSRRHSRHSTTAVRPNPVHQFDVLVTTKMGLQRLTEHIQQHFARALGQLCRLLGG